MNMLKKFSCLVWVFCIISSCFIKNGLADTLVSGVWRKGSNITEPKPQSSSHLKTISGGFGSTDDGVKYLLNVEITKPFKDKMYIKAQFQNPLDMGAPYLEEGEISAGERSLRLVHGPVKGLKIHRSYWVKIYIFSITDKTIPVDTLTQHIKSYFDTTTNEILMKPGLQ